MSRSRFFKTGVEYLRILTRESKTFDSVGKKLEMETFTKGQCICRMVVGQEDTNKYGTLHGGLTASLIDIVTTMAIIGATGKPGVSTDIGVSYLSAAKVGQEIMVDAKCTKIGKSLVFTTADITLADGSPVAQGKHTKYFIPGMPVIFPTDLLEDES
ncbi:acyl-coenzyme A thioesterase 13 [Exaiptasia diaphana]|uniref:Acyl-coenzyme A thioesterase 13 n=1 Tax=Exaiptasia diaphana TaxID=2652724 RepID=A0A913XBZ3_EXADI|nr:acyl-coenzyme A thioesterase 13 [Exaiptasia diaphana]KXJ13205.1 Acyl-coenzyme A thioesterase 13 [Exaiptasia diaphana]